MRKVKKIMDIPEHKVAPINGTSITIDICNVKHTPVHYHASSVEMILCLKGSVSILCNHEPITLKEGEMFAIGFDDLHCMYSDTDNIVVSFYMDMQHMDIPWEILQYTYLGMRR